MKSWPPELDDIAKDIRSKLTKDLRAPQWQDRPGRIEGQCYVASEAAWHILGGSKSNWSPMYLRHHGEPHWYLQDTTGRIIDLVADKMKGKINYNKGRRSAFLTKKPSKRAVILMGRLETRRNPGMNPQDFNYYLNFVLYAATGFLSEADAVVRQSNGGVARVARKLNSKSRKKIGLSPQKVYRGILLEGNQVGADRKIPRLAEPLFMSFSENKDVACWFAYRDSIMSTVVLAQRPDVQGWIAEHKPKWKDVLFHHRWVPQLNEFIRKEVGARDIEHLAQVMTMRHPDSRIRDPIIAHQFMWNLQTQKEVILKPVQEPLQFMPIEEAGCSPVSGLDERLSHPLFRNPIDEEARELERAFRQGEIEPEEYFQRIVRYGASVTAPIISQQMKEAFAAMTGSAEQYLWQIGGASNSFMEANAAACNLLKSINGKENQKELSEKLAYMEGRIGTHVEQVIKGWFEEDAPLYYQAWVQLHDLLSQWDNRINPPKKRSKKSIDNEIKDWVNVAFKAIERRLKFFRGSSFFNLGKPEQYKLSGKYKVIYAGLAKPFPVSKDSWEKERAIVVIEDNEGVTYVSYYRDRLTWEPGETHGAEFVYDDVEIEPGGGGVEYIIKADPRLVSSYSETDENPWEPGEHGSEDLAWKIKEFPITTRQWPQPLMSVIGEVMEF